MLLSRATFLQRSILGTAATSFAGTISFLPDVAHADVTNKVASSTALKSLKRAQRQLTTLLPYVESNDFVQVKESFRTSPFSDVRKNCFILIRGGEDGPKVVELQRTYKNFIANLEKMDSTASLGMRGRSIPEGQLYEEYKAVETTLQEFLVVAVEAAEIPLQY